MILMIFIEIVIFLTIYIFSLELYDFHDFRYSLITFYGFHDFHTSCMEFIDFHNFRNSHMEV